MVNKMLTFASFEKGFEQTAKTCKKQPAFFIIFRRNY
jgi:hypothetical protein